MLEGATSIITYDRPACW